MKTFLLSSVALSLLYVLSEILLNEGELKKYITGILRVIFVIGIFGALIGSTFPNIVDFRSTSSDCIEVSEEFVSEVMKESAEQRIIEELNKIGINGAKVNIFSYCNENVMQIVGVSVDMSESGITEENANIYIIARIKDAVRKHVDISEDLISVYGWN